MARGEAAAALPWFERATAGAPAATRGVMIQACADAWGIELKQPD